jgi:hypothetical protein
MLSLHPPPQGEPISNESTWNCLIINYATDRLLSSPLNSSVSDDDQ